MNLFLSTFRASLSTEVQRATTLASLDNAYQVAGPFQPPPDWAQSWLNTGAVVPPPKEAVFEDYHFATLQLMLADAARDRRLSRALVKRITSSARLAELTQVVRTAFFDTRARILHLLDEVILNCGADSSPALSALTGSRQLVQATTLLQGSLKSALMIKAIEAVATFFLRSHIRNLPFHWRGLSCADAKVTQDLVDREWCSGSIISSSNYLARGCSPDYRSPRTSSDVIRERDRTN